MSIGSITIKRVKWQRLFDEYLVETSFRACFGSDEFGFLDNNQTPKDTKQLQITGRSDVVVSTQLLQE